MKTLWFSPINFKREGELSLEILSARHQTQEKNTFKVIRLKNKITVISKNQRDKRPPLYKVINEMANEFIPFPNILR